ncbi:MAG: glycosyltransferase family 4 protein [Planctomycetaceae bacterium]|nr:glycosyltransferase family 4 protein [Planctomycetaceae bacterium]
MLFLSRPTVETQSAFQGVQLLHANSISAAQVASLDLNVVLLHNTAAGRVAGPLAVPSVMYQHSAGHRANASLKVFCSQWLAKSSNEIDARVLIQSVPEPPRPNERTEARHLRTNLKVGRICTPTSRKWPTDLIDFYAQAAERFPEIEWEFVGVPEQLTDELRRVCLQRARFIDPGWNVRTHLWNWDVMLNRQPQLAESFGRTAADAMRAGCIPVVDNQGGFPEQINSDVGYLCGNDEEFLDALEQLQNADRRYQMSSRAQEHANVQFSLTRFRHDLLQLFHDAISVGPATRP